MRKSFCRGLFVILFFVAFLGTTRTAEAGKVRAYFIAAQEIEWDYAPDGRDSMMGAEFNAEQKVFVEPGPSRTGHIYHKIRYIAYTDASFGTKITPTDASLGILGPVIRAEVGDEIAVTFKNMSSKPLSIHPHGVFYLKDSEGSMTNDGTSGDDMNDDHVRPGDTHVYKWKVPKRAGPGPNDASSVVWLYHSHVDEVRDTNTGLVGPIVITGAGHAKEDGSPIDIDKEFFSLFTVMDENQSLFLNDMKARLKTPPADGDEDFAESNLMHSINGYVFGNMPMPVMTAGEHVRWYVMSLGTEVDLHTPHWHGNTVLVGGRRQDVVSLLPATTVTADMMPDNPGIWMYHCHVNDHISAGMTGRYQVLAPAAKNASVAPEPIVPAQETKPDAGQKAKTPVDAAATPQPAAVTIDDPDEKAAAEPADEPAPEQKASKRQPFGWTVQVASAASEKAAWSMWKKLQRSKKALRGVKPIVVRADLGAKGVFYRVRLRGFDGLGAAKAACNKLKAGGVACFVDKSG